MENNEIVRSLKFYCDAIFKYDYEKDKVFLAKDSPLKIRSAASRINENS